MIQPLRAIVIDARIDASPADVWEALTERMSDWFAPFVKAGQGVGGIVELSWDGTNMWPTTIAVWDPERHLGFADPGPPGPDGAPGPRVMTDWFIMTEEGQTVVRLVHSGFGPGAEWDDQIDGLTGGWTYFMWNLEICLTRHRGIPRIMVSTRPRVKMPRHAFWDALFASGFIRMKPDAAVPTTCTIALGDRALDATVETLDSQARLAARIPDLDDSLLFIELEGTNPSEFHAGFWLSTYGLPAETVSELQRSLDVAVAKVVEPMLPAAL